LGYELSGGVSGDGAAAQSASGFEFSVKVADYNATNGRRVNAPGS